MGFGDFASNSGPGWGDEPDPSEAHLGTWRLVAVVDSGRPVTLGAPVTMTVTPDGYTVKAGGRTYETGTSRADRSRVPVESDVMVFDGPRAGQTLRQMTMIHGDVMIACAGDDRPAQFVSRPGSGHTLSVWLRTS